jgi:Flp pilus assembly protein TadG
VTKFHNDKGAAAVEAAIIFPALVVLLGMLVGFGLVLNVYQSITHAAHEGARYASLGSSTSDVTDRVNETVGALANVTSVTSSGCDATGKATVQVEATVDAVFFEIDLNSSGVERCA